MIAESQNIKSQIENLSEEDKKKLISEISTETANKTVTGVFATYAAGAILAPIILLILLFAFLLISAFLEGKLF